MSTTERRKAASRLKMKQAPDSLKKGKYASMEAASLAKMESAKDFIANIDMTIFKKNGHVE